MVEQDPTARGWVVLGVPIDSVGAPAGGPPFGTEESPTALRSRGLVPRLQAADRGDLDVRVTGPVRDPGTGIVGYPSVRATTVSVRSAVAEVAASGARPFVLGGCCALVMGAVAGLRDVVGRVGVVNVDGHIDAYDGRTSPTGEAADIPVGALLGHGDDDLLAAMGPVPVVRAGDAVVLGARDADEAADLADLPERLGIAVRTGAQVMAEPASAADGALAAFHEAGIGFWLHLDVDVLGADVFPATDYLMPDGLTMSQLAGVLGPLGAADSLLGVSVGCYNPSKDPDGRCGDQLADVLVGAFAPSNRP
jgi:arginase